MAIKIQVYCVKAHFHKLANTWLDDFWIAEYRNGRSVIDSAGNDKAEAIRKIGQALRFNGILEELVIEELPPRDCMSENKLQKAKG